MKRWILLIYLGQTIAFSCKANPESSVAGSDGTATKTSAGGKTHLRPSMTSQRGQGSNSSLTIYFNKIVDAIYIVEGGSKTKYPYGIKSIKTSNPRKVCYNTVANNYQRWIRAGKPGSFIIYLADRYCPPSVDPKGNKNWKNNMRKLGYE